MSEVAVNNKGSKFLKTLGIVAVIAALIAVARIVFRVFNEKKAEPDDGHHGI